MTRVCVPKSNDEFSTLSLMCSLHFNLHDGYCQLHRFSSLWWAALILMIWKRRSKWACRGNFVHWRRLFELQWSCIDDWIQSGSLSMKFCFNVAYRLKYCNRATFINVPVHTNIRGIVWHCTVWNIRDCFGDDVHGGLSFQLVIPNVAVLIKAAF